MVLSRTSTGNALARQPELRAERAGDESDPHVNGGSARSDLAFVLWEVPGDDGQVELPEDGGTGLALEEELERAADEVSRIGGAGRESLEVAAGDADEMLAGAVVVSEPDAAAPRGAVRAAIDLNLGHAWHRGHQYVVRGSSVGSGAERISVSQRRHGRPARR